MFFFEFSAETVFLNVFTTFINEETLEKLYSGFKMLGDPNFITFTVDPQFHKYSYINICGNIE